MRMVLGLEYQYRIRVFKKNVPENIWDSATSLIQRKERQAEALSSIVSYHMQERWNRL